MSKSMASKSMPTCFVRRCLTKLSRRLYTCPVLAFRHPATRHRYPALSPSSVPCVFLWRLRSFCVAKALSQPASSQRNPLTWYLSCLLVCRNPGRQRSLSFRRVDQKTRGGESVSEREREREREEERGRKRESTQEGKTHVKSLGLLKTFPQWSQRHSNRRREISSTTPAAAAE